MTLSLRPAPAGRHASNAFIPRHSWPPAQPSFSGTCLASLKMSLISSPTLPTPPTHSSPPWEERRWGGGDVREEEEEGKVGGGDGRPKKKGKVGTLSSCPRPLPSPISFLTFTASILPPLPPFLTSPPSFPPSLPPSSSHHHHSPCGHSGISWRLIQPDLRCHGYPFPLHRLGERGSIVREWTSGWE